MSFEEFVKVELVVELGGRAHSIPAEDVRLLELDLRSSGFAAVVEFVARDDQAYGGQYADALADTFFAADELTVQVSVTPARPAAEARDDFEPLAVAGRATRRSVQEEATDWSAERPLLWRRYRIELQDPARAHWRQHFPCDLLTDQSLVDVAMAQAPPDVTLTSTWSVATAAQRQWFLHLPEAGGSSFYDFLCWYVERRGGAVVYDYDEREYRIVDAAGGDEPALALFGDDVERVELSLPEPRRARPRVRNSYANAAETVAPEMAEAVAPLVSDDLIRTAVADRQATRAEEHGLRRAQPRPRASLRFGRYPSVQLVPGLRVSCPAEGRFSARSGLVTPNWIVRRVCFSARSEAGATGGSFGPGAVPMRIELSATLWQVEERVVTDWEHVPPRYPGYVEGLVVSQQGEEADKTWDMTQNADTAIDEVEVNVPLFGASVYAPFEPGTVGANVYLPHCRDARVLLSLDVDEARIVRTLSWRQGAALPKEGQGERLVFGKSEESHTKLTHLYDDGAPVFGVVRVNDKDQVALTLSEGKLVIGVAENGG